MCFMFCKGRRTLTGKEPRLPNLINLAAGLKYSNVQETFRPISSFDNYAGVYGVATACMPNSIQVAGHVHVSEG